MQESMDISTDEDPPWVEATAQTYLHCIGEQSLQLFAVMVCVHTLYRPHRHMHAMHGCYHQLYEPCSSSYGAHCLFERTLQHHFSSLLNGRCFLHASKNITSKGIMDWNFSQNSHLVGPNVEMFCSWSLAGLTSVTAFLFHYLNGCSVTELNWQQSPNTWFDLFHAIIVGTEQQCQLMAIASLARVCKAEQDAGDEATLNHSCSLKACIERSFSFFLQLFRRLFR